MDTISALADRIPPQALVLIARTLQALSAPIIALMVFTSRDLSGEVADAISFCNVLFVGNLCAAAVVLTSFGPRRIRADLKDLDKRIYWEILLFGSLSALLAALIFTALESTSVTNVILLARLGPVLFVVGSAIFIGQKIGIAEGLGFGLIGLGVTATVFWGSDFEIATGDILILVSGAVYAVVTIMSKRLLPHTGMPALVFLRTLLSAVVFFVIANVLYGSDHFEHAFYGPLWILMLIYGLVVIVTSQFAWYKGISKLSPSSIARWTIMTPAIAVAFAYFVNGEEPSSVQLVAFGVIMLGVLISNISKFVPKGVSDSAEGSLASS